MGILFSAIYDEWFPFSKLFSGVETVFIPQQLEKGKRNALILWGGEDISPSIYNEIPSKFTNASIELSTRDRQEIALAERAMELGILIIGICRGAQLMCALAGGKVVQHVENHHRSHKITLKDGNKITTNSIHHQMMYLKNVEHDLLAFSKESNVYYGESKNHIYKDIKKEPEIVYIPKTNSLCIQGHPEFLKENNVFVKHCLELVDAYL